MNTRRLGFIYFIIFFFVMLFLKFKFLGTPFFYEERPVVLFHFNEFSLWDLLSHNYSAYRFAHHPTSFPLMTSTILSFIERTPFVVHFVMLIYSSLALCFMALCLHKLIPNPRWLHFLGPLLLLSFPDYFVHSTNFRFDIFTGFIAIMTIYFHYQRNYKFFLISGLILAYSRETVLAFLATFLIIDIFKKFEIKKEKIKYIFTNLGLMGVWFSFFLINYFKFGSFSTSEARSEINQSLEAYLNIFSFDLKWMFLYDFRFILSLLSVIGLALMLKRKEKLPLELLYFILPLVFYALGMGFHIFEASYYLLPILYGLYILFAYFIYQIKLNRYFYLLFIPLSILSFKHLNEIKGYESMRENSTKYIEIVESYQEVINFVGKNLKDKSINAEWPITYYLSDIRNGYTNEYNQKIQTYFSEFWMSDYDTLQAHQADCEKYRSKFEYAIMIEKGNDQHLILQKKYMKSCDYKLAKEFQHKGIKSYLYQRI